MLLKFDHYCNIYLSTVHSYLHVYMTEYEWSFITYSAYYHLVSSKQENKEIDYNLAYDSEGNITTDPVQGD